MALQLKLTYSLVNFALITFLVVICFIVVSSDAMPCKTRIIYKTIHVPVHIIKKVPVIKEVKVPVYIKEKPHHGHHKGHHHEGEMHHEGMHKMGMHDEHGQHGGGGVGGF